MNNSMHFIKRMQLSLYSMGFYKAVIKEKTGKAIFFGILMGLFMGSLTMVAPMVQWSDNVQEVVSDLENAGPTLTIQDGVLKELDRPYALNNGVFALVIDQKPSIPLKTDAILGIYFQKESLKIAGSKLTGSIQGPVEQPYKMLFKEPIHREELTQFVQQFKLIGWLMIPMGGITTIITVFGSSLLAALIGMGIFRANKKPLSFRDSYVVSLYAYTLPMTVGVVTSAFLVAIPQFFLMSLVLVSLTYLRLCHWKPVERNQ